MGEACTTITIPAKKVVRLGPDRYRTLRPVDVPASELEPVKKQTTRMHLWKCPTCGATCRRSEEQGRTGLLCVGAGIGDQSPEGNYAAYAHQDAAAWMVRG